jgi:hypothetical protein
VNLTTHERALQKLILVMLVGFLLRVAGGVLGAVVAIAVMLLAAGVAEWLGARVFATGF